MDLFSPSCRQAKNQVVRRLLPQAAIILDAPLGAFLAKKPPPRLLSKSSLYQLALLQVKPLI